MIEVPLFPLHTVLAPGIVLPLNVFEPRYRKMVRRCLDRDEPFGVIWIRDGREVGPGSVSLATVGTLAEIRTASRTSDGRYELLAAGTRRFRLAAVDAARAPFLVGQAEPLDEPIGDPEPADRLTWLALRRFARYLKLLEPGDGEVAVPIDVRIEVDAGPELAAAVGGDEEATVEPAAAGLVIPDDPAVLSHLLSGILQIEPVRRQELLEAGTAEVRLASLVGLLGRELSLLGGRLRVFAADPVVPPARRN